MLFARLDTGWRPTLTRPAAGRRPLGVPGQLLIINLGLTLYYPDFKSPSYSPLTDRNDYYLQGTMRALRSSETGVWAQNT